MMRAVRTRRPFPPPRVPAHPLPTAGAFMAISNSTPVVVVAMFLTVIAVSVGSADPPAAPKRSPFRGRPPASAPKAARQAPSPDGPTLAVQPSDLPEALRLAPDGPVMDVAPIDRDRRAAVVAAAARIDAILAAAQRRDGLDPEEPLDDARFVRRAWLTLGGRIPTAAEALAFIESRDAEKHAELVDTILESPDWVSHSYNQWADTLRLTERPQFDIICDPYLDWVKRTIAENRPYDEWVREMLTARGKVWDNPAVGYQLRDPGQPLAYVANTVRIFLGTQIGCAECHDHPFAPWTQKQFYELAAFTAGTVTGREEPRKQPDGRMAPSDATRNNFRALTDEINARVRRAREGGEPFEGGPFMGFLRANRARIGFEPRDLTLPHDYRYRDGAPGTVVPGRVPWGDVTADGSETDSRRTFARWVTSSENRQFPRTLANRLWKRCFGVGIVEPIDDFSEANPPSNPELLEALTDLVLELDYDAREFVRVVAMTAAWRHRAVSHDPTSGKAFAFRGPVLRRMSAEQLWDSLLTLIARDRWAFQRLRYEDFSVLKRFDLADEHASFEDGYANYLTFRDRLSPEAIRAALDAKVRFLNYTLAPASELPLPLAASHLLLQFGQGSRDTIDGSRAVPTVPQVLELLHGSTLVAVQDPGSMVMETIAANPPARVADVAFLSVLTRLPTPAERRVVDTAIASATSPREGWKDVLWALVNTREFLFVP